MFWYRRAISPRQQLFQNIITANWPPYPPDLHHWLPLEIRTALWSSSTKKQIFGDSFHDSSQFSVSDINFMIARMRCSSIFTAKTFTELPEYFPVSINPLSYLSLVNYHSHILHAINSISSVKIKKWIIRGIGRPHGSDTRLRGLGIFLCIVCFDNRDTFQLVDMDVLQCEVASNFQGVKNTDMYASVFSLQRLHYRKKKKKKKKTQKNLQY